jgi:hypothetical protein
MIRVCNKRDCGNEPIPRGKYCELHRTSKKRKDTIIRNIEEHNFYTNNYFEEEKRDKEEKNKKLEEDRLIIKQQEEEYIETERLDKEKMENNEFLKVIQESKDYFIKEKRESILKEPDMTEEEIYFFKIKLPNGKSILRRFLKESKLQNIRDYLDIYFYDNNIKIESYNIVLDFPKIIFTDTIDTNNLKLKDVINSKNIILYIENLDE